MGCELSRAWHVSPAPSGRCGRSEQVCCDSPVVGGHAAPGGILGFTQDANESRLHTVTVKGVFLGLGLIQALVGDGHHLLQNVPDVLLPSASRGPSPPSPPHPGLGLRHCGAHQGPQAPHPPIPGTPSPLPAPPLPPRLVTPPTPTQWGHFSLYPTPRLSPPVPGGRAGALAGPSTGDPSSWQWQRKWSQREEAQGGMAMRE